MSARQLVREYDRRHGPHADLWMFGEVIVGIAKGVWWGLRLAARFPVVTFLVAVVGLAYWEYGRLGPASVCLALVVVLVGWRLVDGDTFSEHVSWRVWSSFKAWSTYGRHWESAMTLSGLGARYRHSDYVPVLVRARCGRHVDRLTVQLLQGQHPEEFAQRATTLAHTFGMRSCRVRVARPGVVTLEFARIDPLASIVPAVPLPDPMDIPRPDTGADVEGVA